MPDDSPAVRKPELHPAWKILAGVSVLFFTTVAAGSMVLTSQQDDIRSNASLLQDLSVLLHDIQTQQLAGQERGYALRAVSGCVDIINDQEIEITEECVDPRVAAYYPPSICQKLPVLVDNCGSKAIVISSGGP